MRGKLKPYLSNDECNSTPHSSGRKFLYNSKGLVVISLLVKYYKPLTILTCSVSNGRRNRESATE